MKEWKWGQEAREFIYRRCQNLTGVIENAEQELRKNSSFARLRKAEEEKYQLSQRYALGELIGKRIDVFAAEHKPIEIYRTRYEVEGICRPENKDEECHVLTEYLNRKTGQSVQIYGYYSVDSNGNPGLRAFRRGEKTIKDVEGQIREAEKNLKRFFLNEEEVEVLFFESSLHKYTEEERLTWDRLRGEK